MNEPEPSSNLYINEAERFNKDFALNEYERRQELNEKKRLRNESTPLKKCMRVLNFYHVLDVDADSGGVGVVCVVVVVVVVVVVTAVLWNLWFQLWWLSLMKPDQGN